MTLFVKSLQLSLRPKLNNQHIISHNYERPIHKTMDHRQQHRNRIPIQGRAKGARFITVTMRHSTEHCNVCGLNTEANRNNGWAGNMILTLKSCGNAPCPDRTGINLCQYCAKAVNETLSKRQKSFILRSVVTYTDE